MRCYADNVLVQLEPLETVSSSGLALVHTRAPGAREHRFARVIASGPGYHKKCCGGFVPNETKPGDRVIVDAMAGDKMKYDFDVSAPRQNTQGDMDHLLGERGAWRIVREEEILAIVESGEAVAAE